MQTKAIYLTEDQVTQLIDLVEKELDEYMGIRDEEDDYAKAHESLLRTLLRHKQEF